MPHGRAFVIAADGLVRHSTRLTQLEYHAGEMETALRSAIAGHWVFDGEGISRGME